jgi:hypothetical protein
VPANKEYENDKSLTVSILLAALSLVGCAAGLTEPPSSKKSPLPAEIVVSVSPTFSSLQTAQASEFTASVQNDTQNKGVAWILTRSGTPCSPVCGTIASSISQALYSAPSTLANSSSVNLTATSIADTTKSASAQITLSPPTPAAISVSVSPTTASVQLAQRQQFTASVQNDVQNGGVTWTLTQSGVPCSPACGSVPAWTSNSALYIAPAIPANSPVVTLSATSVADNTQMATATIFVATPLNDTGSNAWIDLTSYGARAIDGQLFAKASCTLNSPNVNISADPGFENGDGVVLYGCGPFTAVAVPSAPKVIPGMAEGEMAPDIPLALSTGSSTYRYSLFLSTTSGGLTAASPPTTITNGPSALGMFTLNVASATLIGGTLTITTSSPHSLPVGTWFNFRGAIPATLDGRYSAFAVTPTTITVLNLPFQAAGVGLMTTGGTVTYAIGNQISVPSVPADSFNVLVCGERPGDSALHIVGAIPVGGYARGYYFTDWGSPFSLSASVFPSYINDTACTASSSNPGYLSTIITSGAGTTSLVLANSALQSASGQTILKDDGLAMKAAAIATVATAGTVYIPVTPGNTSFSINSITTLPSNTRIIQAGSILFNEPVVQTNPVWQGTAGNCAPQFALKSTSCLYQGTAFPAMYLQGNVNVSSVSLSVNPNDLGMVANSPNGLYLDTVQFSGFGLGTIHFVTFGQTDIATVKDCLFDGSQDGWDASWVPLVYFDSYGNSGGYTITNPRLSGRGMFGNDNSNAPGAFSDIRQFTVSSPYHQGASLPTLAVENTGDGIVGTQIYMSAPQIDTSPESAISLGGIPGVGSLSATVTLISPDSSGGTVQFVTGIAPTVYYPEGVTFPSGVVYPEAFIGDLPNGGQLAVPRPYAYDNFNRVDGSLGPNWNVLGGSFSISSNQAAGGEGNGNWSFAQWIGSLFPNQGQFSQVTITNMTGAAGAFVLCSASNLGPTNCGYQCAASRGNLSLVGGNLIKNISHANASGDKIRVEWNPSGNTVTCYVNGVSILSGTDSSFGTGQPGMFALGGGIDNSLDNWSGGSLHPYSTSDQEEDRTQPLHATSLTIGSSSPGSHGDIPFGAFYPYPVLFVNLGTPDDGIIYYCPDCVIANPCSGGGKGAIAKRLNGAWVCN